MRCNAARVSARSAIHWKPDGGFSAAWDCASAKRKPADFDVQCRRLTGESWIPAGGGALLIHPHKIPVMLPRQGPEKRAHFGAFEEEADGVDADAGLAGAGAVEDELEPATDIL